MVIFHSYVSLPEGNDIQSVNKQFENTDIDTNIGDVSFGFKMIEPLEASIFGQIIRLNRKK